ncbi:MAG: CRISPR-associated primase-polymerase type B [Bacteroidota bacterium]|nr:CRISPR-associated primase-polymerase type B [Bacteroidota bacterium]
MTNSEEFSLFLQKGKSITSPGDKLLKIKPEELYFSIYKPAKSLSSQIDSLRTIKTIDEKKYRQQKVNLPYVTTGIFNPPYRKKENFASIGSFIIDLDHVGDYDFNITELKMRLSEDERIMLLFESPGGDGIKLLFRLKEKLYDRHKFSLFYKTFIQKFAAKYSLQSVIDSRTSDVTRACFLSTDREAYFNSNALAVDTHSIINFDNPDEVQQAELFIKQNDHPQSKKTTDKNPLPSDVFREIKEKLNPKLKTKKEKQIFVPEKLNTVMEEIKKLYENHRINTADVSDINYGKKIKLDYKKHTAEINLFFGKRGFTVVKSPKKGTNPELRDLCYKILCDFLY